MVLMENSGTIKSCRICGDKAFSMKLIILLIIYYI